MRHSTDSAVRVASVGVSISRPNSTIHEFIKIPQRFPVKALRFTSVCTSIASF